MLHRENIKYMNIRQVTFLQHKQNLNRKLYTVQYVKKVNFKRLITFNINYYLEILIGKVNMVAVD